MFGFKHLTLASAIAVLVGMGTCQIGMAQPTGLPFGLQQQLQAPNANVQAVALTLAESNPAFTTSLLQSSVDLGGDNSASSANVVKAFADKAVAFMKQGAGHNAALAAALAVAVENAVGDPDNATLVNGQYSAIIAAAKQEADSVLQDTEVQQAILNGAPGTEGTLQAAVNGPFGGFGGITSPGGPGLGSSPAD